MLTPEGSGAERVLLWYRAWRGSLIDNVNSAAENLIRQKASVAERCVMRPSQDGFLWGLRLGINIRDRLKSSGIIGGLPGVMYPEYGDAVV